jgi:phospholipase/lecithinase/hemolysin
MYAFGDSLSDVGNDLLLTKRSATKTPDPGIYTGGGLTGRFTNGANYLDGLAGSLGLGALAPSLDGGTIYAYGGARTTYAAAGLPPQASFDNQIAAYTGKLAATGAMADPNALYVVWIGANDMADAIFGGVTAFLNALGAGGSLTDAQNAAALVIGKAISQAMNSIGQAIAQLAGLGAKHLLVPNLPDLALTPRVNEQRDATLDALARGASVGFNQNLAAVLDLAPFSTLDIRELNIFAALNDIVLNPAGYGMTNVADSCYTGEVNGTALPGKAAQTICGDSASHVFWDYEHPTAAVHSILADQAFAVAIPEPPAIWLLVFVIAGLTTFMRRSSNRKPGRERLSMH